MRGRKLATEAGLRFIPIGVAMVALAAARFFRIAREIDSDAEARGSGSQFDLALAALLVRVGLSMFIYLGRAVLPSL